MTETTSTRNANNAGRVPQASFFKQYLRYSIDKNKTYPLISTVLALLAVPLFVIITVVEFVQILSAEEYNSSLGMILYFSNMFVGASFFGLYILALTGGVRCFKVLTRRNNTDTLMCLPLNHSQRFWGDFLTGYITGVAPIIPAGLVGILIGAIAQGSHPTQQFAKFAFLYALTILLFMTFAYALSVLAAALCGNIPGSIVTSAVLAIVSIGLVECWGRFFSQCIAGFPGNKYLASKLIEPVPQINFFADLLGMFGNIDISVTNSINAILKYGFPVQNPLNVVCYILLPAGFTALAYYIAKHRKPERGGEVFAAKYGAVAVTGLLIVTATGGICCLFTSGFNWIAAAIFSLIASVVICVAVELILRQGVKKLGRRVIAYAAATCAAIGVSILIFGTRALGYSYYVPRASEIESAEYRTQAGDVIFNFNKKSDIEKLRDDHEQILRTYMKNLGTHDIFWDNYEDPNAFTIEYTLKNGKTFRRYYQTRSDEYSVAGRLRAAKAKKALNDLPTALEDFPEQYTAPLNSPKLERAEAALAGTFGSYVIYPNKLSEFAEVLQKDIEEHYDPAAIPIGYATACTSSAERDFDILGAYTNTIIFIRDPANSILTVGDYFTDDQSDIKYVFSYARPNIDIHLTIKKNDSSPAVKELEGLIKVVNRYDLENYYSEEFERALELMSPDEVFHYYITENDLPQATKLILQIASERS